MPSDPASGHVESVYGCTSSVRGKFDRTCAMPDCLECRNPEDPCMDALSNLNVSPVGIGPYRCGDDSPLLLIAGPCVLQSLDSVLEIAETLARLNDRPDVNVVFKAIL